jgi:hypothetical protein
MSDLPPPPPPGGGFTPPPPPPPPPSGGGFNPPPPPPPPPPTGGGFTPPPPPPPPPPSGGYVPPPPSGYTPVAGYATTRKDGLAIGALVVGILAVVCSWPLCLGLLLGPAGGIMGFISRQRIAASGGQVGGGTMALAGLILGVIGFVISASWALLWIFWISHSGTATNTVP